MAIGSKKFFFQSDLNKEVCVIVGTRPGIIMLAPVIHALSKSNIPYFIIHTGQHYSGAMDSELFEDLDLPQPLYHLDGVAEKKTHGGQTAAMLEGCETALIERRPRLVLVNGDANTNLAGALAARKLRLGVGHIEAGERSFDWRMPEVHNRRMMDHISDLLFTTNEKGAKQLRRESVQGQIYVTGNTIVDASLRHARMASLNSNILEKLGLEKNQYILVTSHREENVDDPDRLKNILLGASLAADKTSLPAIFVMHPRTKKRLKEFNIIEDNKLGSNIILIDSVRYLDFMHLLINSSIVLTDSGGVQQEAYIHHKNAVTMRDNTEWTETLENGGNRLSGVDCIDRIVECAMQANGECTDVWPEIFGDGKAAERIITIASEFSEG